MTEQIFNTLIAFFEEDDWEFQWVEGMSVLSMGFAGRNGKWMCYAQAREAQQQFVFYSIFPINVPPDKRPAVAEFITRANYGMIIGNFEMDFDDGEVRYKTSIDVEGGALAAPLIRQLVYANVFITDRYFNGLMSVVYGGQLPKEAIEQIEKADREEDTPGSAFIPPDDRPDFARRPSTPLDDVGLDDDDDDDDDDDLDDDDDDDLDDDDDDDLDDDDDDDLDDDDDDDLDDDDEDYGTLLNGNGKQPH